MSAVSTLSVLAVVIMLGLITVLPHIGREQVVSGKKNVEVWGWNIAGEALGLVAPDFERAYPDSRLDVKVVGTAMQSRFQLSLSSGRGAPDIMQLQERDVGKFTDTGLLADLSPWAAKYEKDFPASFWASSVVDGKVYAIPWDIGPCAVFYKRWLFDQYGVDPEAIETWDDFLAAGKTIYTASGGKTRFFPLAPNASQSMFFLLMQQNGGGVFNAEGEIILDSAQNLEALELLRRMLDSGINATISKNDELNIAYASKDNVAAIPGAVWLMQMMKDTAKDTAGEWGVFRLPAIRPGGLRTSNSGGSVLLVPEQSDESLEAQRFVEMALCTVDGQLKQYSKGLFPAYLPTLTDPRFDQPDPFFGGQHVARLFAQDFEQLAPVVRTRDWGEAEQLISQALQTWAMKRQDSKQCLKETADLLARRLSRRVAK